MNNLRNLQNNIKSYEFSEVLTYRKGDIVTYRSNLYKSLIDNNTSNLNSSNWIKLT